MMYSITCYNLLHYNDTRFSTQKPRLNGQYFPDDIFEWMFLNENICISIKISLDFVRKGSINNVLALIKKWLGADQATSHYLNQWCHCLSPHRCVTRPHQGYSSPKTTLVLNSYIFIWNEDIQNCFSARCRQQLCGTYCTFFRYKF